VKAGSRTIPSELDQTTIEAYRSARYRIDGRFDLIVDRSSTELGAWHAAHGRSCSALITAYNPGGCICSNLDNQVANRRLADIIGKTGLPFLFTVGLDPEGQWPPEPGFLIAGLERDSAEELGRRFGQNAIVWSGADAVPCLLLLR